MQKAAKEKSGRLAPLVPLSLPPCCHPHAPPSFAMPFPLLKWVRNLILTNTFIDVDKYIFQVGNTFCNYEFDFDKYIGSAVLPPPPSCPPFPYLALPFPLNFVRNLIFTKTFINVDKYILLLGNTFINFDKYIRSTDHPPSCPPSPTLPCLFPSSNVCGILFSQRTM